VRTLFRRRGSSALVTKGDHEFAFWEAKKKTEGTLGHSHYEDIFTIGFGLDRAFFARKRLLDVGCGPRGSLEWANDADLRVGLDALVSRYMALDIVDHAMHYTAAPAEYMPFRDGSFDVVSSVNSLDHVDDLDLTLGSIVRVLRKGGAFLLIVEVGHEPTPAEPISLWWDLVDRLRASYSVVSERHLEMGELVYASLWDDEPFDHAKPGRRPGLLVAHLTKN
jgi:SAM-dependent methyltransferase